MARQVQSSELFWSEGEAGSESYFAGPSEISSADIILDKLLGEGTFGSVYSGTCRKKEVAIKILRDQALPEATLNAFRGEVEMMRQIFHPNVVLFMGACTEVGKLMIVTEIMKGGDLENFLHPEDPSTPPASLFTKMKMAKEAALGLNWLHNSNPPIIHQDLKPSNLLLDEHNTVKVADFGLSFFMNTGSTKAYAGTPLYMAPEALLKKDVNEKSDIYSFGLILWEMVTERFPFEDITERKVLEDVVCHKKKRLEIPNEIPQSLKSLIKKCWDPDPNRRPDSSNLISLLDEVIIDCALDDEFGRILWKEHFCDKKGLRLSVRWRELWEAMTAFLHASSITEHNSAYLQTLLCSGDLKKVAEDSEVSIEKFSYVLKFFGPLVMFPPYISALERINELCSKDWFHGEIDREKATERLAGQPPGTFLVRFSESQAGNYTVSWNDAKQNIKHVRVSKVEGEYHISKRTYKSLSELISKEMENNLTMLRKACSGSMFEWINKEIVSIEDPNSRYQEDFDNMPTESNSSYKEYYATINSKKNPK